MTAAADIQRIVCHQCYAVLDVGDHFCRHCGAATDGSGKPPVGSAVVVPEKPPDGPRWSENRWVVLAMLLLVLGPLGLPMLWRSRQFSLFWKAVLTTLMLGMTLAVVGLIWYVLHKALEPLTELRSLQGF